MRSQKHAAEIKIPAPRCGDFYYAVIYILCYNYLSMIHQASKFRVAVHAMTVIADQSELCTRSDQVAASISSDPTAIRKLLACMRDSGLIQALEGRNGGYALARAASRISLLDIYRSIGADDVFPRPARSPNMTCSIGMAIHDVLDRPLDDAIKALETELQNTSLADVLATVRSR
jgi:Rrf2 family protein